MDVQKVAAQAATGMQSQNQRAESNAAGAISSFVEMIRNPLLIAGTAADPFVTVDHEKAAANTEAPEADSDNRPAPRDDNARNDAADNRDTSDRDDASERGGNEQNAGRERDDDGRDDAA